MIPSLFTKRNTWIELLARLLERLKFPKEFRKKFLEEDPDTVLVIITQKKILKEPFKNFLDGSRKNFLNKSRKECLKESRKEFIKEIKEEFQEEFLDESQ